MDFWPQLVLGILATWRITHLLASEDGPWEIIARFRARLGSGLAGKLLDCFQCLSLWVALVTAFLIGRGLVNLILTWLALSGAACLLERLGQEPIVIQPIRQSLEGETNDGMLRSETNGAETNRDEERAPANGGAGGSAAGADGGATRAD